MIICRRKLPFGSYEYIATLMGTTYFLCYDIANATKFISCEQARAAMESLRVEMEMLEV